MQAATDCNSEEVVGVQNELPQHVLLWYVDYIELKATEALQTQEKLLSP